MAQDLNDALDRLAEQVGFRFTGDPLDFVQPRQAIANRKAAQLKQYLDARKAAIELNQPTPEDARAQLLAGAGLTGANPTPQELATFKPGLPSILDLSVPAGSIPPATGTPPVLVPSQTPEAQRLDALDAAAAKNAPAVDAMRQQLNYHAAGITAADVAGVALGRSRDRLTAEDAARWEAVEAEANKPETTPAARVDIMQNKTVFKPERVIHRKSGIDFYMDATPNLSGGYDYTPALDDAGQPIQAPAGKSPSGAKPTAFEKRIKYIASLKYPDDPDGEKKAYDDDQLLKGMPPERAWFTLQRDASKINFGRAAKNPQALYQKTLELWRVSPYAHLPPPAEPPDGAPATKPGAASQPASGAITNIPAPADPALRRAGTVYTTPRGPMQWTGTGWLPAN